ncbi:MAG: chromosome segregation protein SMC [Calditrichaeota bacterium]|nr:chromosome segregation protein SMC [Calditrichota bacterium]
MFITRLEMVGFKSFAAKTSLEFRPGIMAVVGPNGCGKTNIVDAVRWVLGEQRTSLLRAERMESVIFNGTAKRKPLGMAEVTLTIENNNGQLPTHYTEIELTRRLFRSGESEYLINRHPSRLRDIMDLFMDTGFGVGAYSIIELAMVDGIINGPSTARRVLIEEAAGVAHFKSRRTAAERRLESTREALLRLNDVYNEVEKTYHSLKRQAARAKRAQNLQRALQLRIVAELGCERLRLQARSLHLTAEMSRLEEINQNLEFNLAAATANLLALEARELALNDRIGRTMESLKRYERREAELNGEAALARQRVEYLKAELKRSEAQRIELEAELKQTDGIIVQTNDDIAKLKVRKTQLEELNLRQCEADTRCEQEIAAARQRYTELNYRLADVERNIRRAREAARAATERRSSLLTELQNISSRLQEGQFQSERLTTEIAALKSKLDEYRRQSKASEIEYSQSEQALEKAQVESTKLNRRAAEAAARLETVRAALKAHLNRSEAQTSLPQVIRNYVRKHRLLSLAERVECPEIYRNLIAAALRDALTAVDVNSLADALELAAHLGKGEQTILRAVNVKTPQFAKPSLPAGAETCFWCDKLIDNADELGEFLRKRLSNVLCVPHNNIVAELCRWASIHNVRLLTPAGWRLDPDGLLFAGDIDPEAYQLSWSARLRQLESDTEAAEAENIRAESAAVEARQQLLAMEKTCFTTRQNCHNCEAQVASTERSLANLNSDLAALQLHLDAWNAEEARIKSHLAALDNESEAETVPDASESLLHRLQQEKERAEEDIRLAESARNEAFASKSAYLSELAGLDERLNVLHQALEKIQKEKDKAHSSLSAAAAQKASALSDIKRAELALDGLGGQCLLLSKEKDDIAKNLDDAKSERSVVRADRERSTAELKRLQELQKSTLQERNAGELELAASRERLRDIDRRLTEDAGIVISTLDAETVEEAQNELKALALSDVSTEQMKIRLQALGPVNMLALEELKAADERYHFLTDQKKDLESGVELLTETIDRIDVEARRRLRETFDKVNVNFQNLFRALFEGGEARLTLDGADPLDADIRIYATPTGKKLQNLSMLSGGEKALTAIALLFAIYQVRPSPFCILDEVDAPLDDANIVRFNNMIRSFTKETQFLIVTHNKRTMEAADCLFGVTLDENGISQLVSVKLESNLAV